MVFERNRTKGYESAAWKMIFALAISVFLSGLARGTAYQEASGKTTGAAKGFREVTDEVGRTVRIPQPVRRVVSLAPSLTETIYALGLQNLLVGDTDYCDYPPDAMKKQKVGGAINPNMEEIVALQPDLVLVTKSLNRLETVNALEQLGIATYATDPHTVEDIIASSKRLGEILGAPEAGEKLAAELNQRLVKLKERLAGFPTKRVLFVVWTEPLISAGENTFIADALRYAGAESIIETKRDWPQISLEEVVHLQPKYLVFAADHSETATEDVDQLALRPGWDELEAVKQKKFAVMSEAVNRPAPRIVSAIEELARQLHPEAFAEKPAEEGKKVDVRSLAKVKN
jgi:iron complex transport system substrate-binding protein